MNPLRQLREIGQSPWYDYIRRGLMTSGQLKQLIDQDGLMGMTSNPAIFEKAIAGSADYDEALTQLVQQGAGVQEIYETLAIQDIQDAADALISVYQASEGRDGYVSLEVSPHLAFETQATIDEAHRLWKAVSRPNVMIKVPGTPEGLPAVEELLGQGININITLLFSVEVYKQVAWAYIKGVSKYVEAGGNPKRIASVASFFVSRIDSLIDKKLEAYFEKTSDSGQRTHLEALMGKVAIANAKLAYQAYEEIFSSPDFRRLKAKGGKFNGCYGPVRARKIPNIPIRIMSINLLVPIRSIPCRKPRTWRFVTMEQCARRYRRAWKKRRLSFINCLMRAFPWRLWQKHCFGMARNYLWMPLISSWKWSAKNGKPFGVTPWIAWIMPLVLCKAPSIRPWKTCVPDRLRDGSGPRIPLYGIKILRISRLFGSP